MERFVENLKVEYEARLKEKEASPAWDSFSKQVLAEAEREASRIKLRAKQESEIEASRMISEAKRDVQESMDRAARRAQDITEKQVQDILAAASKKAQITETRARQLSQLMLIRAREDIQDHITGEVRSAYNKLNSMLEDLIGEARSIDGEWREKTLELWNSPALDEDQTALLGSEYVEALPKESETPVQTQESVMAPDMQAAEPEAAVASVEQSTSFEESGASSEESPKMGTSLGEVTEPPPTVEPSLGEHLPEIIQSAEASAAEDVSNENREAAEILLPEPSASEAEPVVETTADSGKEMAPTFQVEAEPKLEVPEVAEPIIPMVGQEEATDILAPEVAEPIIPMAEQEEVTDILAANVSELIPVPEKEELESEEGEESLGLSKSEPLIQIPGEEQAPEAKAEEGIVTGGAPPPASLGEVLQPKEVQQPGNQEQEFRDMFSGEVDLVLSPPLDFSRVSELYSHLQTLPEIRVLHTAGSWEQGTVVTVAMDTPGPLLSPLNALPTLEATPEVLEGSLGMLRTAMGSLGERGRRRQRINITFRNPQDAKEGQDTDDEGQTGLADV